MSSPSYTPRQNAHRAALLWPARARRRWPAAWCLAFVALVAALSFVLAGPAATASASSPPPAAAGSASSGEPSFWDRMRLRMHEYVDGGSLDSNDRYYIPKSIVQVGVKRVYTLATKPTVNGLPSLTDLGSAIAEDVVEINRRRMGTVKGLKKQVTDAGNRIHALNEKKAKAKTGAEKERVEQELREAREHEKKVAKKLRDAKAAQPVPVKTAIKHLDKDIRRLENKISALERKKDSARVQAGRDLVQKQIDATREELTEAKDERDRLRQRPDDDDPGAKPAKRSPKTPQGPGTTSAKTPKQTTVTPVTPAKTSTTAVAKTPPKTTVITGPKVPRTVPFQGKAPGIGSPRGAVVAQAVGDLLGQVQAEYAQRQQQTVLDEALNDPAKRARLIAEHREYEAQNVWEQSVRPFTGKEFGPGDLRDNGPKLIEVEKTLDTVKKKAERSNADPHYRRARVECGGYDTCVTERTRKLREKNRKDIAESTEKARKSNADPHYRRARVECGGYDTCVTERTRKLRAEAKNADKSHADESKEQRARDDARSQHSQKASDSKKSTDTSDSGKDRNERDKHKDDKKSGPAKSKYENRAV